MMHINIDGAILLAEAILKLCVKDYRKAMRTLQRNPGSYRAKDDIRQIEMFFHSQLFAAMVDADPDQVIDRLREECKQHDGKRISKSGKVAGSKNKEQNGRG